MKKILIVIGLVLVSFLIKAQSIDSIFVDLNLQNSSFETFISVLKKQTDLSYIYKPESFSETIVNITGSNISLYSALKSVLNPTDFHFSLYESYIIIDQVKLISKLPNYRFKGKIDEEIINKPTQNYMKGRRADLLEFTIGAAKYPVFGRKVIIGGRIIDEQENHGVEGATIYIDELREGTVSDIDGKFQLKVPSGKYSVRVECLGMKKTLCHLNVISNGEFELHMKKANFEMDELVVYGDRQMSIREKDPGLEKISVKSIKELPKMMGESDIIKISELLPGVVSVGDGAAGLNVRGGGSDQNAFYFNNIPVYNTSHMFGFFPAFNADIISDFSIYKGYIPAQYGGKISSIFDIQARSGNKKRYTAHGGISPIAGNLTIEGPIKKDTASFFVSGRTSYSDWILKQVDDYVIRNSKASFYDLNAGLNYDLPKTQIGIFGYYSQDYFKLSDINTYWYSNKGVSANIGHNFKSDWRGDFSLSAAGYQFQTMDKQYATTSYEHEFGVAQYDLKANLQKQLFKEHNFNFGINSVLYNINRGDVVPHGSESQLMPILLGKERGVETSLYLSDKYEITPLLEFIAGFRFSAYSAFGSKKVFTYFENGPMDSKTVSDSIMFSSGQAIKWYYFPEFRLALNYQTDELGSIKLGFNQMHQNIFMLNNAITIAPNSQWKLADYHLKPSTSYQVSLGIFRSVPSGIWEASAEVFYKNTENYTEFKDGANFIGSPYVERTVLQGNQNSYGLEFLLKKNGNKFSGWLAYTYSRSLIHVDGGQKWNQINQGDIYPSNFDIPHVFNAIFNYHISTRVIFSSTITYQSGKPSTFPTSYYFIDGEPYLDYSKRNEYRIPNYFRTDVSLTIEGNLRKKKLLHSTFVFSVYNLTSRDNPYSVYFTKEDGMIKSYQYAVIGVPVFTVSWIFKLGNFDAD